MIIFETFGGGFPVLTLILLSLALSGAIVALAPKFPRFFGQAGNLSAVQAMHNRPTARIGGVAIFGTLLIGILFSADPLTGPFGRIILAASPLFVAGLLEDLGYQVSPRRRLIVAFIASIAAIILLGGWIPRADVPLLDTLMAHWFVGIIMTVLVTAGITNGFNLIDGVNGLASVAAISAALALAMIAAKVGYTPLSQFAILLAAGVLGFFLLNYPLGLIFLGDAGAYTLGFVLSWLGVAILLYAPDVTPWAILLTMFWPVADMLLAFYRRLRQKSEATAADRLHAHQVVMRALEICVLGRNRRNIANPLTTLLLAPFVIAPPIAAVMFWDQPDMAFRSILFCAVVFGLSYTALTNAVRRLRRKRNPRWNAPDLKRTKLAPSPMK